MKLHIPSPFGFRKKHISVQFENAIISNGSKNVSRQRGRFKSAISNQEKIWGLSCTKNASKIYHTCPTRKAAAEIPEYDLVIPLGSTGLFRQTAILSSLHVLVETDRVASSCADETQQILQTKCSHSFKYACDICG